MSYWLESAWKDLIRALGTFRFGWPAGDADPCGYLFRSPAQVVKEFLKVHPRHQQCQVELLEHLRGASNYTENGKVRVPTNSALGRSLTP